MMVLRSTTNTGVSSWERQVPLKGGYKHVLVPTLYSQEITRQPPFRGFSRRVLKILVAPMLHVLAFGSSVTAPAIFSLSWSKGVACRVASC